MANDFSEDANCKAVWNFESGAVPFLADSKGGNTLNNQGVDEDTTNYKQGSCSSAYIRANSDRFYVLNSALDSGFPFKYGESNKNFSITTWAKFTGTISDAQVLAGFYDYNDYIFRFVLQNSKIALDVSRSGISWDDRVQHATALVTGRWYHIAVTYDNSDYSTRIRIWDDTAQAIVGVDADDTSGDATIRDSIFAIGMNTESYAQDGNLDEFVIFNDVLSVAEIDQIRAGTYGAGGVDETVEPATLALEVTQETPSIAWDSSISPTTLALTLTQQVVTSVWDSSVSPTTLELALTQETPAVGSFCTITPDALNLALTLENPTVSFPIQTVLPTTLSLALTQHVPSILAGTIIEPATFELALTRQMPGLSISSTVLISDVLSLALTRQTPTILFPIQTILPTTFSLALAQQTPVILAGDVCIVTVDSALALALAVEAPAILKNTLSWSAGLLTYKGITYEISAGVTQKKFVYWDPNYTTVFRATDVLQDIFDADGWVMCLNESGVAYPAFARKLIHGGIIQAGTITAAYGQIAALTVGSGELKDLAVSSGKIANSAVEEAKIAASAISEGKLAALSVSSAKIQAAAITAAKIQDLAVTSAKIGDLQVTNAKIQNLTVGTSKIAADATKKKRTSSTDGSISIGLDEVEVERINDFDSDGNEIEVHFHCEVTHSDIIGYARVVNLYRDTTKIRSSNVFIPLGGGVVDIMWYYTPDSVEHDYVVKIDGYYFSDAAQYRRIAINQDKGK